jgi:hypothetical protein
MSWAELREPMACPHRGKPDFRSALGRQPPIWSLSSTDRCE